MRIKLRIFSEVESEALEIFEFTPGRLVFFNIRLVKDFHGADFAILFCRVLKATSRES